MPWIAVIGAPGGLEAYWRSQGARQLGWILVVEFTAVDRNQGVWKDEGKAGPEEWSRHKYYCGNLPPQYPVSWRDITSLDTANDVSKEDIEYRIEDIFKNGRYHIIGGPGWLEERWVRDFNAVNSVAGTFSFAVPRDIHRCGAHKHGNDIWVGTAAIAANTIDYRAVPDFTPEIQSDERVQRDNWEYRDKYIERARKKAAKEQEAYDILEKAKADAAAKKIKESEKNTVVPVNQVSLPVNQTPPTATSQPIYQPVYQPPPQPQTTGGISIDKNVLIAGGAGFAAIVGILLLKG